MQSLLNQFEGAPALTEQAEPAEGTVTPAAAPATPSTASSLPVREVTVGAIHIRDGFNARQGLTDDAPELDELKRSLAQGGLYQPILVRPVGDRFDLIAGERRFRSARSLGWTTIAATVRPMTDDEADVAMLTENEQRKDLTLAEKAAAWERVMARRGWTQDTLADKLGISGSWISTVRKIARSCGKPWSKNESFQQQPKPSRLYSTLERATKVSRAPRTFLCAGSLRAGQPPRRSQTWCAWPSKKDVSQTAFCMRWKGHLKRAIGGIVGQNARGRSGERRSSRS
jgi:ParB/RepB/Spo0J family partition protein